MKKTETLIIRLTRDQKDAINAATDRMGYPSVSAFINEAIKANLDDKEMEMYLVPAKPIAKSCAIKSHAVKSDIPKSNSKMFDPKEPVY